jgi:formylglycine-generating enzyme required for sulfatase activity
LPPVRSVAPTAFPAAPQILPAVGSYRLLERIGQGAYGVVWRAEAPGEVAVAIKIIRQSIDHDDAQQELQALERTKTLRHPFLLQTQAYWIHQDQIYIVMELADDSLRGRMKLGQPMLADELVGYLREAAEALDFLHAEGVLHRDIKPENILLFQGHAKVADFGLSSSLELGRTHLSVTSSGTPHYMAPEVWMGQTGKPSDQYSLALTYAEVRLGQRLFSAKNLADLLTQHQTGQPDLRRLGLAEQDVLRRALAKAPRDRYATCREFAKDLEQAMASESRQVAPPAGEAALCPTTQRQVTQPTVVSSHSPPEVVRPAAELSSVHSRPRSRKEAALPTPMVSLPDREARLPVSGRTGPTAQRRPTASVPPAVAPARRRAKVLAPVLLVLVGGSATLTGLLFLKPTLKQLEDPVPAESSNGSGPQLDNRSDQNTSQAGHLSPIGQADARPSKVPDHYVLRCIPMKMVRIPRGTFRMGSPAAEKDRRDNERQHEVEITRDFAMSVHEVTVGQFRAFVAATNYRTDAEKDEEGGYGYNAATGRIEGPHPKYTWRNTGWAQPDAHPVVNVTWNDAVAFCAWLRKVEDQHYRLPTEAEWEYACRAGTQGRFHSGDDEHRLRLFANLGHRAFPRGSAESWTKPEKAEPIFTVPVGQFQPNAFGLYDMHGNAWEWCQDWYEEHYYRMSPRQDPQGPVAGNVRVLRGGSFTSPVWHCRAASRFEIQATRSCSIGFRVVCER